MPFFLPGYDMTPDWKPVSEHPSAIVLRFHHPSDLRELYRFIDILIEFLDLNEGSVALTPLPRVTNDDGEEVPLSLLPLIARHRPPLRLSFYLFGAYYRDVLREYCRGGIERFRSDKTIVACFERLRRDHLITEIPPYAVN